MYSVIKRAVDVLSESAACSWAKLLLNNIDIAYLSHAYDCVLGNITDSEAGM